MISDFCVQTCELKLMEQAIMWNLKAKIWKLRGGVLKRITMFCDNSFRHTQKRMSKSNCSLVSCVISDFYAQACESKLMGQVIIWNLKIEILILRGRVMKKIPPLCHNS